MEPTSEGRGFSRANSRSIIHAFHRSAEGRSAGEAEATELPSVMPPPYPSRNHQRPDPALSYPHAGHARIPGSLVADLAACGKDPARATLEALLVEGYRTRMLSEGEIKRILGYGTRTQVHSLLKEHDVPPDITMEYLEQDRETHRLLRGRQAAAAA